jgi:hypothetical protein
VRRPRPELWADRCYGSHDPPHKPYCWASYTTSWDAKLDTASDQPTSKDLRVTYRVRRRCAWRTSPPHANRRIAHKASRGATLTVPCVNRPLKPQRWLSPRKRCIIWPPATSAARLFHSIYQARHFVEWHMQTGNAVRSRINGLLSSRRPPHSYQTRAQGEYIDLGLADLPNPALVCHSGGSAWPINKSRSLPRDSLPRPPWHQS